MHSSTPQPTAAAGLDGLITPRNQFALAVVTSLAMAAIWWLMQQPLQPLLVVGLCWCVVLFWRHPFVICLLFVTFSYFRIHEAFPVLLPLQIPSMLGLFAVGALVFHLFLARTITPIWSPEIKLFVAFFGLVSIGSVLAVIPERATTYWSEIYVKIGMMTLAIAWLARTRRDFASATQILILSGAVVALVAIYNKIYGIDLVGTRVSIGRELKSSIGDPNDLALVLLFPFGFAAAQLVHRSSAVNVVLGALALPLLVIAIIATQSRGGLLGVLMVAVVIGLRQVRSKALMWAACAVLAVALYMAMGLGKRDDYGSTKDAIDESSQGRLHAWSAATRMAIKRPVTGVGMSNFVDSYDSYRWEFDGRDHAVHSTWFEVLAETGFPGIAVFIAMIMASFRSIIASLKSLIDAKADPVLCATALALLAGLAGFCAAGTFLTQAFTWPLYVMIGLTTAVGSYVERETRPPPGHAQPAPVSTQVPPVS